MAISFKPDDMMKSKPGGLFQEGDVLVKHSRAAIFDFNGGTPALTAHIILVPVDDKGNPIEDAKEQDQHYSAGSLQYFSPSETEDGAPMTDVGDEGPFFVPSEGSTATQLSSGTNFGFFIQELISAGYTPDKLSNDLSALEGMIIHVIRKPVPTNGRSTSTAEPKIGKDGKPMSKINPLVPDKVLRFPWDVKGPATKAATAGAKGGGSDLTALAVTSLRSALEKSGGEGTPDNLRKLVFTDLVKKQASSGDRNNVAKLIIDTAWLEANQGPDTFIFADGKIVLS